VVVVVDSLKVEEMDSMEVEQMNSIAVSLLVALEETVNLGARVVHRP
jgi:hypothetical protein